MKLRRDSSASLALFVVLALLAGSAALAASPLDELRSESRLQNLDLAKLKTGEIAGARGNTSSFARGVQAESLYFIHASLAQAGEKLLHWDPSSHRELEIKMLREVRWPPDGQAFATLSLSPHNHADRWLIDRTAAGRDADLHLLATERQKLPRDASAESATHFWRDILLTRHREVAIGGLGGVRGYQAGDVQIFPRSELEGLLKLAPSIANRFHPLLARAPFRGDGPAADSMVPWWEASLTRGHTGLHAGFVAAVKSPESWQAADCTFYTTDTYFFSLALYQMWSFENGTLIWQIDFASAPFRAYAAGVDRYFALGEMLKDTAKTARAFQSDSER